MDVRALVYREMNTFGRLLRLTTFGESHGIAIGGILDGFPSGLTIDLALVQEALERRRPGHSALTSPRREPDELRVLSGIYEGRTTGAPIAFVIENQDTRGVGGELQPERRLSVSLLEPWRVSGYIPEE